MRLKSVISILIASVIFASFLTPALARKKLQRRRKAPPPKTAWVKLKLRNDRHALLLMLGGMHYVESLNYVLTYNAGPVPQGIQSYHTPEDGNTQKELVFGTCSGNDCIYHNNITDMILELTIKLKEGQTIIQRYQINP